MWGTIRLVLSLLKLAWDVFKSVREEVRLAREDKIRREVDAAPVKKDQRELEKAIGSDNAGKPAKNRDGVTEHPAKKRGRK